MSTVGTMSNITRLQLSHTLVTDAGLLSLRSLQDLEYLNLTDTKITDTGLRALEQLPKGVSSGGCDRSRERDVGGVA